MKVHILFLCLIPVLLMLSTPAFADDAHTTQAKYAKQEKPLLFTKWMGNVDKKAKKHPLILAPQHKTKKLLLTPPKKRVPLLLK